MNYLFFEILLEVGRQGRSFTYKDGVQLGVEVGDLVRVQLRGRLMNGLVVGKCQPSSSSLFDAQLNKGKQIEYLNIEEIVQKSAVDPAWRIWLDAMAKNCYISSFRMMKAALPSGWLGEQKRHRNKSTYWWISLTNNGNSINQNLSVRQSKLEELLKSSGGAAWQKDLQANGFSSTLIKKFVCEGYASREKRLFLEESRSSLESPLKTLEKPRRLTKEQEEAMDTYNNLEEGESLLLWGVTGSGKTEVYLQIAANELQAGRHCLILTPEIGLIPQLVDRFKSRFGSKVLEYHSNRSEKERVSTWSTLINSSKTFIVVGTRSAVFLPFKRLGLIVLDEEHDSSYKQESPMPCYHARDLALDRAKRCGAKVVLGSATPSLITWKNISSKKGGMKVANLKHRIANQSLPIVKIIDMRKELSDGHRRLISRPLMDHLSVLRESGDQAILLVPRRGYSTFLSCRSCGEVVQCPNCDVSLTVHRNNQGSQWLRCHWCDYRAQITSVCKECGSNAFKPFGAGTQRVLENLANELEGLRLLRFDRDTTGGRDGHRKLLNQFAEGQADVLIGTQMLSKGMDLPNVTLAAVLAADGLLHRPDLSSGEQTLQLFMQLAGRAGRGEKPGKVLVQTYCPEHPVIEHLVDGSYEEFLKQESQLRKEAGLVPYRRACILRFSGESSIETAKAANVLTEKIRQECNSKGWIVIGPAPSLVSKVAGKSRWQLLLHGPELSSLPFSESHDLWEYLPECVNLSVDPDPMQL